jgi:hypothetical protein
MIDISYLIKDFIKCRGDLQWWINNRFNSKKQFAIDRRIFDKKLFQYIVAADGTKYVLRDGANVCNVPDVKRDYRFDDIRKEDIVLDIGANVGGFAIPASRMSDHVFAVEPFTLGELYENIMLNKAKVTLIDGALGNGTPQEIQWATITKIIKTFTLAKLKEKCGGKVDFLKCDVEGFEWEIDPWSFEGIRRIELECHYFPKPYPQPNPGLLMYLEKHYHIETSDRDEEPDVKIVHAVAKWA